MYNVTFYKEYINGLCYNNAKEISKRIFLQNVDDDKPISLEKT